MSQNKDSVEPQIKTPLENHFQKKYGIADGNTFSVVKSTTELYIEFQDIYYDDTLTVGDLAKWLNNNGYKLSPESEWYLLENE